jgi:hypothetical protein
MRLNSKIFTLFTATALALLVGMGATALASVPSRALCHQRASYKTTFKGKSYTTTESCVDFLNLSGRSFPRNQGAATYSYHSGNPSINGQGVLIYHGPVFSKLTLHYRPKGFNQDSFAPLLHSGGSYSSVLGGADYLKLTRQSKNCWTYLVENYTYGSRHQLEKQTYVAYEVHVRGGWAESDGPSISGWNSSLKPTATLLKAAESVTGYLN